MEILVNKTLVSCLSGDITLQKVDAIVNAANSNLAGGGGVDGAIHRAGGPMIMAECRRITADIGTLPVGEAVATTAGELNARRVIHTVGPVWRGGEQNERERLTGAYRNSLKCCEIEGLKTVAFPAISAGVYGYPLDQAADVAMSTVCDYLRNTAAFTEVRFVLFNEEALTSFSAALAEAG
jgi:O-acetyl-ADP-ribose deacetylase (regulator of RNase III)